MEPSLRCSKWRLNCRSHYLSVIEQQQNLLVQYYSKIDLLSIMMDSFIPTCHPTYHNNKYWPKASIYNPYYYPAITVSFQAVSFFFFIPSTLLFTGHVFFEFSFLQRTNTITRYNSFLSNVWHYNAHSYLWNILEGEPNRWLNKSYDRKYIYHHHHQQQQQNQWFLLSNNNGFWQWWASRQQ